MRTGLLRSKSGAQSVPGLILCPLPSLEWGTYLSYLVAGCIGGAPCSRERSVRCPAWFGRVGWVLLLCGCSVVCCVVAFEALVPAFVLCLHFWRLLVFGRFEPVLSFPRNTSLPAFSTARLHVGKHPSSRHWQPVHCTGALQQAAVHLHC